MYETTLSIRCPYRMLTPLPLISREDIIVQINFPFVIRSSFYYSVNDKIMMLNVQNCYHMQP